jgi:hypothetical protein
MQRSTIVESYGDYCARRADELAAESAAAVASVDYELIVICRECRGSGTVRHSCGGGLSNWIEESCRWCKGSGAQARYPIPVADLPPAA